MQKIFKEGKKYTFNDYFKMNSPTTEIVTALGYSLLIQEISLPKHEDNPQALLKYISTTYYALIPPEDLHDIVAILIGILEM